MNDLKNSKLVEGQFGEWIKVANVMMKNKRMMLFEQYQFPLTNSRKEDISQMDKGKETEKIMADGVQGSEENETGCEERVSECRNYKGEKLEERPEEEASKEKMAPRVEGNGTGRQCTRKIGMNEEMKLKRGEGMSVGMEGEREC